MTAIQYNRGHEVYYDYDKEEWLYSDDNTSAKVDRPCKRCGHSPNEKGHDYCLSDLGDNVSNACCGHGISTPYIQLKDGRVFVMK